MTENPSSNKSTKSNDHEFNLTRLTIPVYMCHFKVGHALCSNDTLLIAQNGPTTIEVRMPPKFEPKQVPWHEGLLRDSIWCSQLNVFVFLTQKSLFSFDPKLLFTRSAMTDEERLQSSINAYSTIKPYDDKNSFWRCTCAGTTLYITYSGFGTTIDEYSLESSSCRLVKRWTPPHTCATHEGIWCIRYHSNLDQIGMTIMNSHNNEWRFEIRNRKDLSQIWQTGLPVRHGDCELSPLGNTQWLVINSCGVRLLQIGDEKFKVAVEYERELRNAITIGNDYFVIRTKNTVDVHVMKTKGDK